MDYYQWWKESKVFTCEGENLKERPREGLELWYRIAWTPYRVSAWAFELVRRLPKCDTNLPAEHRSIIEGMPPYTRLSRGQRHWLRLAIENGRFRPPAVFGSNGAVPLPNYSRPFPPLCFDLSADNHTLVKRFLAWVDCERKRLSVPSKGVGPKDKSRRNIAQSHKLGYWRHVELLELDRDELKAAEDDKRRKVLQRAKKYRTLVVEAWQTSASSSLLYPLPADAIPGLMDQMFTENQVKDAIDRATKMPSA